MKAATLGWDARIGLREHVYGRLLACNAEVVIEQTAGDFFELLVADDFRIFRSDFVAHRIGINWSAFVVCVAIFDKPFPCYYPKRSNLLYRSPTLAINKLSLPASRNPPAIFRGPHR